MQNGFSNDRDNFDFEIPQEVKEKMQKAKNLHELILEENVKDLSYIDVNNSTYVHIKRILDVALSLAGILILLIPIAVIALIVYIDDPGKIIFSQYRVGLEGKRFKLYKFRTMKQDTPKYLSTMEVVDPDKFITSAGHILRKLSLDEIPQLFNVLKGDMSLVGPRPLISDEYEIHQMRMRFGVYKIRPGVTGLAQINGRDTISPEEKVRWDVLYLKKFGFMLDIKIFLATIPKVFGGTGVVEGFDSSKTKTTEN